MFGQVFIFKDTNIILLLFETFFRERAYVKKLIF